MLPDDAGILSLRDANQRFYDAFGSLDMAQMDSVWEQSDRRSASIPAGSPSWAGRTSGDHGKASSTAPR